MRGNPPWGRGLQPVPTTEIIRHTGLGSVGYRGTLPIGVGGSRRRAYDANASSIGQPIHGTW